MHWQGRASAGSAVGEHSLLRQVHTDAVEQELHLRELEAVEPELDSEACSGS